MEGFQSLRRSFVFHPAGERNMPRVTPSQWGVLMMLDGRGLSTVKDVAEALRVTSSAATQLVDGLVASGYVMRKEHPEDRRQVVLTLSRKTKNQVEKMKKQFSNQFLEFFEVLDDKEFGQLIMLHKKIFERFSKK